MPNFSPFLNQTKFSFHLSISVSFPPKYLRCFRLSGKAASFLKFSASKFFIRGRRALLAPLPDWLLDVSRPR